MLSKIDYNLQNSFHLSGAVWFMNEQTNKWVKRPNTVFATTKLSLIRLYG